MAQEIVLTQFFRIGPFANLETPYASKPADTPKFGVTALFPKNGICKPNGRAESNPANIVEALNKVCLAEFGVDYATLMANHAAYGIQYPPKFVDGDQDWQKDQNNNPMIGQVRPESAGMFKLPMKSADPVDLVSPNGKENLAPSQVCSGYWARAEISVDAYTNKSKQRVLSIKLLNLQLAYVDEKLASGGGQKNAGTQTFGSMAIGDSNVQPAMNGIPQPTPGIPGVPGIPAPAAMVPGMPVPGQMPGYAPQAAPAGMVPGVPGMAPGYAPAAVPGQVPGYAPAAMVPGVAPGQVPGIPAPTTVPVPAPIPAPAAVPNCKVIMKAGELPYAQYMASPGWTDELLVAHGKADWNYTYVG